MQRYGFYSEWQNILKENTEKRHIFMSFLQFFLKLVLELHTKRGVFGALRAVEGAFSSTFVFFLMEIVPQ